MQDTVYTTGTPEDREAIIDFGNMVFSQTRVPHDFKALLPKTYADGQTGIEEWHYLAKQNGKIVGLVACRPTPLVIAGETLDCGYIGTVSVHLYHRGEGHMKALMKLMLDTERKRGRDMLILGGKRQRYNYFGFERAGTELKWQITPTNIRHTCGELDAGGISFPEIVSQDDPLLDQAKALSDSLPIHGVRPRGDYLLFMHSWRSHLRAVMIDGVFAGYMMGEITELALKDENDLPRVLKAFFAQTDSESVTLACNPVEKERIAILSTIAETCTLSPSKMVQVFDWVRTLRALLRLQARIRRLEDGIMTFLPEGSRAFTVRVKDGVPEVYLDTRKPDLTLPALEMERLFFFLPSALSHPLPFGWAPLPFTISGADTF